MLGSVHHLAKIVLAQIVMGFIESTDNIKPIHRNYAFFVDDSTHVFTLYLKLFHNCACVK